MLHRGIVSGFCLTVSILVSGFAAPGDVDRRFKPKLPPNARVTTVFEQSDGRLLVAGHIVSAPGSKALSSTFFIRLRANGQPDPSFRPQRSGLIIHDVGEMMERGDGIGVIGSFQEGTNGPLRNAVVFERSGKRAPYQPALPFSKGTWLPDGGIAFDGFLHGSNGRIGFLDANGEGPIYVETPYADAQFVWLQAIPDGDVVGYLFRPAPVPPGEPRELMYSLRAGGFRFPDGPVPIPALGPSNTLFLATDYLLLWRGAGPFVYQLPSAVFDRLPRTIPCLAAHPDGSVVYSVRYTDGRSTFIFRCTPTGANDETFPTLMPNGPVTGLLALRSGKTLAWGDFTKINDVPARQLVRLSHE
jgi:hypothetical protein